jgi:hypothetical protein
MSKVQYHPGQKGAVSDQRNPGYVSTDAPDVDALNALEDPVLLHPYDKVRDPKKHLAFAPDGSVIALDEVGQAAIDVFDLDRDKLTQARRLQIEAARANFGLEVGYAAATADISAIKARIEQIHSEIAAPTQQFSAATRDAIMIVRVSLGL